MRNDNTDISSWTNFRNAIGPRKEAMRIALIYGAIGAVWILLSDEILSSIVSNGEMYRHLQTIKGWIYVVSTVLMVYFLIRNRLLVLKQVSDNVIYNYEELSSVYEELSAVEEELRVQYEEMEKHRDALMISDQRYKLITDGANDGIWDWDIPSDVLYFSSKWKKDFGYTEEDQNFNFESWKSLLHEDDREASTKRLEDYLKSKDGVYQQTYRLRKKDGTYRWILSNGIAIWDESGRAIRIAGSHTDITDLKELENRLSIMAYHDELTDLPNKFFFDSNIQAIIEEMKTDERLALIYIDIDNFKHINDTLGHYSGDLLLKYLGNIFKYQIKAPDFVARISGDEFAIVFQNIANEEDVIHRLDKINKYIRRPWMLGGQEYYISFSMGIALFPEHGVDLHTLLKNADTAMFNAKNNGKDNYCFYTQQMNDKAVKYIQIVNQLRNAIKNEEFVLYYQPQINSGTGKMEGMEALIRWINPEVGFISPMEFIPLAEETGIIKSIDMWVLRKVCEQQKKWSEKGFAPVHISINLSGKSITNLSLVEDIKNMMKEFHINSNHIGIEITETAIMADVDAAINVLGQLKNLGLKVSLDDFGIGYSSLNYLQKLPIDTVKMDREFIRRITEVDRDRLIVQSIIQLVHSLNLQVLAEGVETLEQVELLRELKCNMIQGYVFSKPMTTKHLESSILQKQI